MEYRKESQYRRLFELDKSEIYAQDAAKLIDQVQQNENFREASMRMMRATEKVMKDFMIKKKYVEQEDVVNFLDAIQNASMDILTKKPELSHAFVVLIVLIAFKLKTVEKKQTPEEETPVPESAEETPTAPEQEAPKE